MHSEVVREWLQKAEEDYNAVVKLEPAETPYVICFHCQQCIEKYLKAFLTARGEIPPPTHNLIRLNSTATEYEKSLDVIYDFLEELNPYSVAIRYPGMSVTSEDAERAIEIMNNLRLRLKDLIDKVTNSK
ncbi:MAG: HEPN domain-containing protein [Methanosarcinaceae archaeon]